MELICYLHPGWRPLIRPASAQRAWMDATPESFAYRCLPLSIANAHGWEVATPRAVEAWWDGGSGVEAVHLQVEGEPDPVSAPVSMFGQGVLTFHLAGLFRTPSGWNLWVGGPPNQGKDGISPLSGVIETDWSPFTFTMNWRFTRPNHRVRFEADEPIAFLFPVERAVLESVEPRFAPLESAPELQAAFHNWSRSREAFQREMAAHPPSKPADRWQKHYYQGVDSGGKRHVEDHRTKLRVRPFPPEAPATAVCPVAPEASPVQDADRHAALAGLLKAARRQADLTQAQFAARLGQPLAFVCEVEDGERRMDVVEFCAWAECLAVEPYSLLADLCGRWAPRP